MGKTAIFGGTFNPIHTGHLRLCSVCCNKLGIEKAMLIPANVPPHKAAKQLAANEDRLAMCRLAVKDMPYVTVSDMEMTAGGKSYTILTMRRLKEEHPDEHYYFVMGTDMFLCFDRWYEWQEILNYCDLAVSVRKADEYEKILAKKEELFAAYPHLRRDCVHTVDADCIDISSTELRTMLEQNDLRLKEYLPDAVYAYIKEHGLYQPKEGDAE